MYMQDVTIMFILTMHVREDYNSNSSVGGESEPKMAGPQALVVRALARGPEILATVLKVNVKICYVVAYII